MGAIKLKHTSGNGTILNSPAANPSSDITLKLPSTTGSAGQVLSVASANHSSTNAELEFVAAGGGKVLKYETYSSTTATSTSGQTFVDTGLSGTIQPSAASSKILVIVNQFFRTTSSTVNTGTSVQVLEGSNVIVASSTNDIYYFGGGGSQSTSMNFQDRYSVIMVNTPSYSVGDTLTYKTQMKSLSDNGVTSSTAQNSSTPSFLTLLELGA